MDSQCGLGPRGNWAKNGKTASSSHFGELIEDQGLKVSDPRLIHRSVEGGKGVNGVEGVEGVTKVDAIRTRNSALLRMSSQDGPLCAWLGSKI
jgi:hypothetical protein